MPEQPLIFIFVCPRCDKPFSENTQFKVEERVKEHVNQAHPEYDPEWFDTAPHANPIQD